MMKSLLSKLKLKIANIKFDFKWNEHVKKKIVFNIPDMDYYIMDYRPVYFGIIGPNDKEHNEGDLDIIYQISCTALNEHDAIYIEFIISDDSIRIIIQTGDTILKDIVRDYNYHPSNFEQPANISEEIIDSILSDIKKVHQGVLDYLNLYRYSFSMDDDDDTKQLDPIKILLEDLRPIKPSDISEQ